MSKSPSALPAFSYNWVGGDIQGLSRLAGVLYSFAGQSDEPVSVLKSTVGRLVAESGEPSWKGSAAYDFRSDFGQDVTDVHWLSSRANSVGGIVDGLAVSLAKIESWLESQAEQGVRAKYITIDGAGKLGLPHGTSDPRVQNFLQHFNQCRSQALMAAKVARKRAASKLASEFKFLSGGLKNYQDNHKNLLSTSEIDSLSKNLSQLQASEAKAEKMLHPSGPHWDAAMKGAIGGASTLGGTVAIFATETGPLDPPIAVGAGVVGGVVGFFKGLTTGNGDVLDW